MNLEEKINEELKSAIKSGNKTRIETLRSLRASIIEFNKSGAGRQMNEDEEIKLLKSAAKRRKDAIEMYEKGGRQELADKEKEELAIISEFLPEQLTEDKLKIIVLKAIEDLDAKGMQDMGKIMGTVMKIVKGQADGNMVRQIVQAELSKL
jgi:uncharacterized protein YqeY